MKKVLVILGLLGVVFLIAAVSLGGAFVSRRNEMVTQREPSRPPGPRWIMSFNGERISSRTW
jgi:hypothetical protein